MEDEDFTELQPSPTDRMEDEDLPRTESNLSDLQSSPTVVVPEATPGRHGNSNNSSNNDVVIQRVYACYEIATKTTDLM